MARPQRDWTRRSLVTAVATAGASLAGCAGLRGETDDETPFSDHAASSGIDGAPRLGPPPTEATAVIVEFGDPSCGQCATFAAETFPELRSDLLETGRAAYYWRAKPVVEPWAATATRALLAVHERDPETFWRLKDRYYAERSAIEDDDDALTVALEGLADDAVSGDAVVADVRAGAGDDRLELDETAATESDVTSVPSFVLFRDDAYVTTVVGPHNLEVFEGALDL